MSCTQFLTSYIILYTRNGNDREQAMQIQEHILLKKKKNPRAY